MVDFSSFPTMHTNAPKSTPFLLTTHEGRQICLDASQLAVMHETTDVAKPLSFLFANGSLVEGDLPRFTEIAAALMAHNPDYVIVKAAILGRRYLINTSFVIAVGKYEDLALPTEISFHFGSTARFPFTFDEVKEAFNVLNKTSDMPTLVIAEA